MRRKRASSRPRSRCRSTCCNARSTVTTLADNGAPLRNRLSDLRARFDTSAAHLPTRGGGFHPAQYSLGQVAGGHGGPVVRPLGDGAAPLPVHARRRARTTTRRASAGDCRIRRPAPRHHESVDGEGNRGARAALAAATRRCARAGEEAPLGRGGRRHHLRSAIRRVERRPENLAARDPRSRAEPRAHHARRARSGARRRGRASHEPRAHRDLRGPGVQPARHARQGEKHHAIATLRADAAARVHRARGADDRGRARGRRCESVRRFRRDA